MTVCCHLCFWLPQPGGQWHRSGISRGALPRLHTQDLVSCQACSLSWPGEHFTWPSQASQHLILSVPAARLSLPTLPKFLHQVLQKCIPRTPGCTLPCDEQDPATPAPPENPPASFLFSQKDRPPLTWEKQPSSLLAHRLQPHLFQQALNPSLGEGTPFQLSPSLDSASFRVLPRSS